MDCYGMRKSKLRAVFKNGPQFEQQMKQYTLEYYHTIVRTPMLRFKRHILSQYAKRQIQETMITQLEN